MKAYEERKRESYISNGKQKGVQSSAKDRKRNMPLSWKQSEGLLHRFGGNNLDMKENMTGFHQSEQDKQESHQVKESFRDENAFGNISVGSNKKKESYVVLSEKKSFQGKTLEEREKRLHMENHHTEYNPNGRFLTNTGKRDDGAWAFQGKSSMSENKILNKIEEDYQKNGSDMISEMLPFVNVKSEKESLTGLHEIKREYHSILSDKQKKDIDGQALELERNISRLEQLQRDVKKDLRFAWKKAEINSKTDDIHRQPVYTGENSHSESENGEEELPEEEKNEGCL